MNCKKLLSLAVAGLSSFVLPANTTSPGDSIQQIDTDYINWYNLSPKKDKILGAEVDRAYLELLQDRPAKRKIVVAVIDAGVDVEHEDLKDNIWVNEGEIPNNGKDDDENGYIDDVHGWNFLGNADGENIHYATYEFVRVIRDYAPLFEDVKDESELPEDQRAKYRMYRDCVAEYEETHESAKKQYDSFKNFKFVFDSNEELLQKELDIEGRIEKKHLARIQSESKEVYQAVAFFEHIYREGFTYEDMDQMVDHLSSRVEKHLNKDFVPRSIIGDDLGELEGYYGNNDVKGSRSTHGSLVAGVIGASRNNDLGINGIADAVEIMVLRTVPDGDEYDKDVARSIIYAVDNGADVINMSFGKGYSPHKYLVDSALSYAAGKNVLLVHAAGNDASNNDTVPNFPAAYYAPGDTLPNWMTVGAIDQKKGKRMVAGFSNYGQRSVDLMAPGVNIVSTYPESTYQVTQGTSFAAPVVSGVAALVWSRYPELSAVELKQVLMESSYQKYSRKKVYQPVGSDDREKVRFYELSRAGGMVNAYQALQRAEEIVQEKSVEAKLDGRGFE